MTAWEEQGEQNEKLVKTMSAMHRNSMRRLRRPTGRFAQSHRRPEEDAGSAGAADGIRRWAANTRQQQVPPLRALKVAHFGRDDNFQVGADNQSCVRAEWPKHEVALLKPLRLAFEGGSGGVSLLGEGVYAGAMGVGVVGVGGNAACFNCTRASATSPCRGAGPRRRD